MSQLKIDQAAQEVERASRRFDSTLNDLHHALESRTEKAGLIVTKASDALSDPQKIIDDYVIEKKAVVENYIKENAEEIKTHLKEEASEFLKTSFEDAGKLSDEVIDRVENRVKGLITEVGKAAEDGLRLSNEKPLLFLGAVFGVGFLAGWMMTRRGIPKLASDPIEDEMNSTASIEGESASAA